METATSLTSKRVALIVGAGAIIVGGIVYYLRRDGTKAEPVKFSRQQILKVMTRIRRNYYPIFNYLWMTANRSLGDIRQAYGFVPEEVKKSLPTMMINNNPEFTRLVKEMESEVYSEFGIDNKVQFEAAAMELSESDQEIKKILDEIEAKLFKTASGQKISEDIPIAEHIRPEKTLEVYKLMVHSILTKVNDYMSELVQTEGRLPMNSPEFNLKFQEMLNPGAVKKQLLRENGYDYSDVHHESQIYATSMKKFSQGNTEFARCAKIIDEANGKLIRAHLLPAQDMAKLREKIERVLQVEMKAEAPIIDLVPDAERVAAERQRLLEEGQSLKTGAKQEEKPGNEGEKQETQEAEPQADKKAEEKNAEVVAKVEDKANEAGDVTVQNGDKTDTTPDAEQAGNRDFEVAEETLNETKTEPVSEVGEDKEPALEADKSQDKQPELETENVEPTAPAEANKEEDPDEFLKKMAEEMKEIHDHTIKKAEEEKKNKEQKEEDAEKESLGSKYMDAESDGSKSGIIDDI